MMELMQTQEQPGVLVEVIQEVLRRAAADHAAPKSTNEGKKRKAATAPDEGGGEATLKVPLEGQPLASLSAFLQEKRGKLGAQVTSCPFSNCDSVVNMVNRVEQRWQPCWLRYRNQQRAR